MRSKMCLIYHAAASRSLHNGEIRQRWCSSKTAMCVAMCVCLCVSFFCPAPALYKSWVRKEYASHSFRAEVINGTNQILLEYKTTSEPLSHRSAKMGGAIWEKQDHTTEPGVDLQCHNWGRFSLISVTSSTAGVRDPERHDLLWLLGLGGSSHDPKSIPFHPRFLSRSCFQGPSVIRMN